MSQTSKIVMAFGTFDYFHAGHENYLKQAKALGDQLIVVVARNETVRKVKQKEPRFNERKRLRDVSQCTHVDKAVLGYSDDKYKIIKKYRPHIIALGYDQFVFTYGLKQLIIKENLETKIVRMQAFEPRTFKSSIIRSQEEGNEETATTPCEPNTATT